MIDAKTLKQIAALQCAVRVMEEHKAVDGGEAGGYSATQIYEAKAELMGLITEMEGTQ